MITKSLLAWLSLFSPNSQEAKDNNPIPQIQESIHSTFSENPKINENNTVSSKEFLEILQWDIKQKIIKWTLVYFDKHVTFKLSETEKQELTNKLNIYLAKYPNIISIKGNQVILKITEAQFKELFKILLPYFDKGEALKVYPKIIRENDYAILRHIRNSTWEKAEFYFFHYFGYLIMDIVESLWNYNMTIGYYRAQMLNAMPNEYIQKQTYNTNMLDDNITNLPKYF